MNKEGEHHPQPFWQHDLLVDLSTVSPHPDVSVRLRIHETTESYSRAGGREIVPLTHTQGERRYFLAKPYLLEPDIVVTVGLFPELASNGTEDGAIGQVTESSWEGMRHRDIGQAQTWYYPADRTLIIWECVLDERYRTEPPVRMAC